MSIPLYVMSQPGREDVVRGLSITLKQRFPLHRVSRTDIYSQQPFGQTVLEMTKDCENSDPAFVLLDDFWLRSALTEQLFAQALAAIRLYGADAVRFDGPECRYYTFADGIQLPGLMTISRRSDYLSSFAPTLFRVGHLRRFLEKDDSPWTAETEGTKRLGRMAGLRLHLAPFTGWVNMLRQGKPTQRPAAKLLWAEVNLQARPAIRF